VCLESSANLAPASPAQSLTATADGLQQTSAIRDVAEA